MAKIGLFLKTTLGWLFYLKTLINLEFVENIYEIMSEPFFLGRLEKKYGLNYGKILPKKIKYVYSDWKVKSHRVLSIPTCEKSHWHSL